MGEIPCVLKLNDAMNKMSSRYAPDEEWRRRSIYRLPTFVTNLKSKAFKPRMVSIGPYHHGDENLQAMEEHKLRALFYFLKRSKEPLESYVNALAEVVQELKDAYDNLDLKWQQNTEEFLELMILDGCFILEILSTTISTDVQNSNHDQARNDPIFSVHGKLYLVPFVRRDILMLENQLPLLVLEKLLNVQRASSRDQVTKELNTLMLNFFHGQSFQNRGRMLLGDGSLHMLDIYRKQLAFEHHPRYKKRAGKTLYRGGEFILSATELYQSGIKFRKSKSTNLKDISFRHGVLYLPVIVLDDAMELLFANMIAFERFHVGAGNEVMSYICFMDSIIKSPTDVTLLQSHGIVLNALGSDKAVVNLINSLSAGVTLNPDSDLFEVYEEVRASFMRPWSRWRANLKHDYFNNPKDSFNIQMGAFLFIFTIIQTIFAVLSYTSSATRTH